MIDREEMKKHRYNLDDLMLQLRQNKIMNVADVEFAILEPSGKLSVVEKDVKETASADTKQKGTIRYEGFRCLLLWMEKYRMIIWRK